MSVFCLVLFVDDEGTNNIDVVPTEWLYCDDKDQHLCCRFIHEQPTPEESQYFHNLVKNRNPPDQNWNSYRVEVQGVADTYIEAMGKLAILNQNKHAFSTDDDEKIRKKQEEIKQKCLLRGGNKPDIKKQLMSSRLDLSKPVNKSNDGNRHQPESSSEEDSSKDNGSRSSSNSSETDATRAIQRSKFKGFNKINKDDLGNQSTTGASKSHFKRLASNNQANHAVTPTSSINKKQQPRVKQFSEEHISEDSNSHSDVHSSPDPDTRRTVCQSKSKGLNNINKDDLKKQSTTGASKSQFKRLASNNQADHAVPPTSSIKEKQHQHTKKIPEENMSEDSGSNSDVHSARDTDMRHTVFPSTSKESIQLDKAESKKNTGSKMSSKGKSPFNTDEIKDVRDLANLMCKHFIRFSQQLGNIQSDMHALKCGFYRLSNPQASGPVEETRRLLRLPIETKEDFEKLNNSLKKENSKQRNELRKEMKQIVWNINMPNKSLVQNLTDVLAKFFTTEMINQFTSQKQTGDKTVFKFTEFGPCLFDIMREDLANHGSAFKDKEFYDAVGRVINNAKTWNKDNKNNK